MANQTLAEFTEKLFVADADHTFIWDTANAISKRVSRNSWLSGTTADFHLGLADAASPVAQTISVQSVVAGTSNTAGANLSINGSQGTGTGVGGSLLLRTAPAGSSGTAQNALVTAVAITSAGNVGIGTTSPAAKLDVAGAVTAAGYYTATSGGVSLVANGLWQQGTGHLTLASGAILGWSGAANVNTDQPGVTRLQSEGTGILALRNGANAQTFNVYGTYTSGTSYERLTLSAPSAANAIIGTNKGSGGGTARGLEFQTDGVSRWSISTAGHLLAAADNTYDIGASGANRPRNLYIGSDFIGQTIRITNINTNNNSNTVLTFTGGTDNLLFATGGTSPRINFCGTTNLFPAIKRSSTTLQARLADDSAFAPIQGKLTTDTAYTGTVVAATGYITIYDSTGAAYRVPCAV